MAESKQASKRRVAVTGLGAISPLGNSAEATWQALLAGQSGIGPITRFDASNHKTKIAAEIKDFRPEDFMDKKLAKRLDVFIQYALAASRMALEDSGLKITPDIELETGCILGCGLGGLMTVEANHKMLLERGPDKVSPFFVPMLIGNMAPGIVSIELGLKGPNLSVSTACAAGTHAAGLAYQMIKYRGYKAILTGGAEGVITPLAVSGFNALKALSTRNSEPGRASRPFDKDRDGFIIGEGSGVLMLEDWEHAQNRGARIYAEVAGFGLSSDAYHMTAPPEDGSGAAEAMRTAIKDAGLPLEDIGYVNAHGTSTELNDAIETRALKTVFGGLAYKLAISSTKSMTGHLLGAAGGLESVFCALALRQGMLPPTANLEEPSPDCDLDYIPNQPRKAQVKAAMNNSFGFGGTNGSLIFKAV